VAGKTLSIPDGLSRMPTRGRDPPLDVDEMMSCLVEAEGEGGAARYLRSEWYGDLVRYKLGGMENQSLSENQRRLIKRRSKRVVLDEEGRLYYRERNGVLAPCVMEEDVDEVLASAHDLHGHFSIGITMAHLMGRYWWPSRSADVASHCRTCDICQRTAPLRLSNGLRPILHLMAMDLLGMDYLGPVRPTSVNGNRFVLIFVDYFSRFIVAKAYPDATSKNVLDLFSQYFVPFFGYPRAVYSDRGTHFVGGVFSQHLESRKIPHYEAPPYSPSSVGLAERSVRNVTHALRALVLTNPTENTPRWDEFLQDAVWSVNTRFIRGIGYSPSQLLFGYNLRRQVPVRPTLRDTLVDDMLSRLGSGEDVMPPETMEYAVRLAHLDELRESALDNLAEQQRRLVESRNRPARERDPVPGDLILLRRVVVDKERGHKLEPRWVGPYYCTRLTRGGRSAYYSEVTNREFEVGRRHMNQLRVYCPRVERQVDRDVHAMEDFFAEGGFTREISFEGL
jgi:transposase InsO family protein